MDEESQYLLDSDAAGSLCSSTLDLSLGQYESRLYAKRGVRLESVSEIEHEQIVLTWSDVTVSAPMQTSSSWWECFRFRKIAAAEKEQKQHRKILKEASGVAKPGELLAIMGGSGAGKSTLLNVLTQRNLNKLEVEGTVAVNGRRISASEMRQTSAYVQQDDLFMENLTVREHLIFYALLRMDKRFDYGTRLARVNEVISELGLEKCQDTIIGNPETTRGISGGERKRLAFASEILTNPPLLFCDEPSSGLDSFMAQQVVSVLQNIASKGKTVICTIHQPSSAVFRMFDRLCLMAEGRVLYLGETKAAAGLFESVGYTCPKNYNPADHYIRTIAAVPGKDEQVRTKIKKLQQAYAKSEEQKQVTEATAKHAADLKTMKSLPKYKASWCQQFRALTWRAALAHKREAWFIQVQLYRTLTLGLIIGLAYLGDVNGNEYITNINGALFQLVINMSILYLFTIIHVFCPELPVFLREHLSGLYRADAYFCSKVLVEIPQHIISPIIFSTILYWMAGLYPTPGAFFIALGIDILTANIAVSLGHLMSCLTGDLKLAIAVTPMLLVFLRLFSGYYINQRSIPDYFIWLKHLSYFKYSFEALAINQWSNIDFIPGCGNQTCPENGHEVLQMLSFDENNFPLDITVLVIVMIGIRILAFIALLLRCSRKT